MRVKMEAGCGITEILMAGCGMKIRWRDRDILRFVGGIGDRTSIGGIIIKLKLRFKYLFDMKNFHNP